jgi:hypothetical protein
MDIPDIGTMKSCFTDGVAWEENPITGFRTLQGTELQQAGKDAVLFPETNMTAHYNQATLGELRSDGLVALHLIDKQGMEETWFFDPLTHFLVEVQQTLDAGVRGSYRVRVTTSEYLPVGDLMIPHIIETSTPAFKVLVNLQETRINAEIPEYVFKKPQG